jgi:hypothetical protein
MTDVTKDIGQTALAITEVTATPYIKASADIVVPDEYKVTICADVGRLTTNALDEPIQVRVEASPFSSTRGHWHAIAEQNTGVDAAESEALTQTEPAPEDELEVSSLTNLTPGKHIYLRKSGTPAQSEFAYIVNTLATPNRVVIFEETVYDHDTGTTIYTEAERFEFEVCLVARARLRVVFDGLQNGSESFACQAHYILGAATE